MAPSRSRHRRLRLLVALALIGLVWGGGVGATVGAQAADGAEVLVTTVDDAITPVIADHLTDGLRRAAEGGYEAYVVRLDTPGGLGESTRDIVQAFLDAEVPVVVYVSPGGARAASAGALITFAAHVAAMAPGTAIGAATPVGLQGGDLDEKVVNDAAAFAESIAQLRGRNVAFAGDTVREARSAPAEEAVELGAVDLVARSLPSLLDEIDGTTVELAGRQVTLRTADAAVVEDDLGLFRRILQWLADPNLVFLFLSVGTLGLLYELVSPGVGVGGALGAAMIVLGLFGLAVLPVNAAGLLLLLLAAGLLVAELLAPGIGIFAALGAVALVLSGLFLFSGVSGVSVSLGVLLPVALVVGGGAVVAGRIAVRTRAGPATTTGKGFLDGRIVTVGRAAGRSGQAKVEGSWWSLRSSGSDLEPGQAVRVVAVEGIDLIVEPVPGEGGDVSRADDERGAS